MSQVRLKDARTDGMTGVIRHRHIKKQQTGGVTRGIGWERLLKERMGTAGSMQEEDSEGHRKKVHGIGLRGEEKRPALDEQFSIQSPPLQPLDMRAAIRIIKEIYTGVNHAGRDEINLVLKDEIFKETTLRVEKTGMGRIRIQVLTDDRAVMRFFHGFSEDIKAGLLMRGLRVDEFRIGR